MYLGNICSAKRTYFGSICDVKQRERVTLQDVLKTKTGNSFAGNKVRMTSHSKYYIPLVISFLWDGEENKKEKATVVCDEFQTNSSTATST